MLYNTKQVKSKYKQLQDRKLNKKSQAMKVIAMIQRLNKTLLWNNTITKNQLNKILNLHKTNSKLILNLNQKFNLMMMMNQIQKFLNKDLELKVQSINKLHHKLHKLITVDLLSEWNNLFHITSRMITVKANWIVRITYQNHKTILLKVRTCFTKILTRRDMFLKVFKAVIQMNKVKKLDFNHLHNIKTSKN